MKDLEIILENKPGQLALLGETLGENAISLEGGGVFDNGESAIAHFLVEESSRAREVLEKAGIKVNKINDVIIQKLRQDVPGQLGMFCRKLADANVNILTQYSDHSNQLVVVPDDYEKAKKVSDEWMKEWW
ncbi:MAG: amino acid-binding ACT domain-containing protein [Actinomycetota bacterium]